MATVQGDADPRLTAARPDLARTGLEGRVSAERFVEPRPAQAKYGRIAVRRAPAHSAALDTEVLFGETVAVLEERDGWCWVQLDRDDYVGYVEARALRSEPIASTHRIKALATFVYPEASIKTPPVDEFALGSCITVAEVGESLSLLASGGYVATRHTARIDRYERDFVDVAERFIGMPYLWGGRTRSGLDCSGLVQTALHAVGFLDTPRDSHRQEMAVGSAVLIPDTLDGLRRGDLVFWRGHVGIMLDEVMLLHANSHHMAVAVEPLMTAATRIGRDGSVVTGIRRLPALSAAGQFAAAEASPAT